MTNIRCLTIMLIALVLTSFAPQMASAQNTTFNLPQHQCACTLAGRPCLCQQTGVSCGCTQQNNQQQNNQNSSQSAQAMRVAGANSLKMQQALDNKNHPLGALPSPQNIGGPGRLTDRQMGNIASRTGEWLSQVANRPEKTAQAARASGQAQSSSGANAIGEVARDQGVNAIEFTSKFLSNFTADGGNKWNRIRNEIFLPIAVLLLLPGAVMTQVKAIIAAGNPTVATSSPLEGIQRSLIAIFLIPGSYLVVNYGIDFANSVSFTIASEYRRLFGTSMYYDAMCAEIRAFTPRHAAENDGSLKVPPFNDTPINPRGWFSPIESDWGKLYDPCVGLNLAPKDRDDGAAPADTIAKRMVLNTTNATLTITWGILCAFQMAFMYYLFFVGPIMAALWVYPVKMLRDAFPNWVEGVITLCCWSLFWHTTILLMGCFKGTDDTGIIMMTALNFLATASVKYAFDFVGLVKAAGQKAMELGEKLGEAAAKDKGKSGGGGGGGGGGNGGGGGKKEGEGNPDGKPEDDNGQGPAPLPPAPGTDRVPVFAEAPGETAEIDEDPSKSPPSVLAEALPPGTTNHPVVVQGEYLAFYNPRTKQHELATVRGLSGEEVPEFKLNGDRVETYDPATGTYLAATARDANGNQTDFYKLESDTLLAFDKTRNMYAEFNPKGMSIVPPPAADAVVKSDSVTNPPLNTRASLDSQRLAQVSASLGSLTASAGLKGWADPVTAATSGAALNAAFQNAEALKPSALPVVQATPVQIAAASTVKAVSQTVVQPITQTVAQAATQPVVPPVVQPVVQPLPVYALAAAPSIGEESTDKNAVTALKPPSAPVYSRESAPASDAKTLAGLVPSGHTAQTDQPVVQPLPVYALAAAPSVGEENVQGPGVTALKPAGTPVYSKEALPAIEDKSVAASVQSHQSAQPIQSAAKPVQPVVQPIPVYGLAALTGSDMEKTMRPAVHTVKQSLPPVYSRESAPSTDFQPLSSPPPLMAGPNPESSPLPSAQRAEVSAQPSVKPVVPSAQPAPSYALAAADIDQAVSAVSPVVSKSASHVPVYSKDAGPRVDSKFVSALPPLVADIQAANDAREATSPPLVKPTPAEAVLLRPSSQPTIAESSIAAVSHVASEKTVVHATPIPPSSAVQHEADIEMPPVHALAAAQIMNAKRPPVDVVISQSAPASPAYSRDIPNVVPDLELRPVIDAAMEYSFAAGNSHKASEAGNAIACAATPVNPSFSKSAVPSTQGAKINQSTEEHIVVRLTEGVNAPLTEGAKAALAEGVNAPLAEGANAAPAERSSSTLIAEGASVLPKESGLVLGKAAPPTEGVNAPLTDTLKGAPLLSVAAPADRKRPYDKVGTETLHLGERAEHLRMREENSQTALPESAALPCEVAEDHPTSVNDEHAQGEALALMEKMNKVVEPIAGQELTNETAPLRNLQQVLLNCTPISSVASHAHSNNASFNSSLLDSWGLSEVQSESPWSATT
ncbi:MAG TPA: hypothetical protein V6D17_18445 [Candidatus Obscuribacterales bacterium]